MGKKKPKDSFYRTTISIPQELKDRMDEAGQDINWSAVAARAFEATLDEITTRKAVKTMEDSIARLRSLKRQSGDKAYKNGEKAGTEWAMKHAHPDELDALEETEARVGNDWWRLFDSDACSKSQSTADMVFSWMHGDDEGYNDGSDNWWNEAVGDDYEKLIKNDEYVRGFVEGAIGYWREAKEQL